MIIRQGKNDDIKNIIPLWLSFFRDDTNDIANKYLAKRIKVKEILVAENNGNIIGFLTFKKNYFFNSDYIEAVIIDKKYHRGGIASLFIKTVEKQAAKRKCRRIFSSVEPWNKPAIKLHKKLGYIKCGFIDHIWGEGKRDVFFSKKLRP